jgi:hypothetical protein
MPRWGFLPQLFTNPREVYTHRFFSLCKSKNNSGLAIGRVFFWVPSSKPLCCIWDITPSSSTWAELFLCT